MVGQAAKALSKELASDAQDWWAAHEAWLRAAKARDRKIMDAERKLLAATGGLGLAYWESACRRKRIVNVEDARLKARAVRARPAVEAALSARELVLAEQEAATLSARLVLAEASRRMARYGVVGAGALGLSVGELRRLGRRPPRPGHQGLY